MCDELKGDEPRKDEAKADSETNNATPKKDFNQPIGAVALPRSPNVEPAKSNAGHPNKTEKYSVEWWKVRIEIIGIIAAVIMTFLMFGQWREMVRTTNVAIGQLNVMQGQLNEAKTARMLGERAWITVASMDQIPAQDNWTAEIHYKNTGLTPAINIKMFGNEAKSLKDIPSLDSMPVPENPYGGMLAPGAAINTPRIIITQGMANRIESGVPYFIYGTIWYDDIFMKHHWSQFCFEFKAASLTNIVNGTPATITTTFTGIPTSQHNSCDDAQTNQTN